MLNLRSPRQHAIQLLHLLLSQPCRPTQQQVLDTWPAIRSQKPAARSLFPPI